MAGHVPYVPPAPLLVLALKALLPILALAVVAAVVDSSAATVGVAFGVMSGLGVAGRQVGWGLRSLVWLLSVASLLAGLLAESVWPAVAAVVVTGLVQAPFSTRCVGAATMLPALVAAGATVDFPGPALSLAGWLLAGLVLATVLVRLLAPAGEVVRVDEGTAWRHAAATAVVAAAGLWASLQLDVPHGYWVVATTVAVLLPLPDDRARLLRDRLAGTLAGALLAIGLVVVLPTAASSLLGLACLVLTIGWALAGDLRLSMVFVVPALVLLGSSGLVEQGLSIAVERLLLTALGVTLAAAAAIGIAWLDRRADRPTSSGAGQMPV